MLQPPLSAEAVIRQIEEVGYCRLPQIYSPQEVAKALELIKRWHEKTENSLPTDIPFLNRNQPNVYNLQNKDIFFLELLFKSPLLQQILIYFLNDTWYKQIPAQEPNYILRALGARSSCAALPLHIDSFVPYEGNTVIAMQYAIVLEDQNEENGCTLVVPGSHRFGAYAEQTALKDAIPISSQAGDVVLWDSRTWHGTTENISGKTRWAMVATFTRWWIKQFFDIPRNLPAEIYTQLSDSQKAVLGFCSMPHNTEFEGIDLKRGYESLPPHSPLR